MAKNIGGPTALEGVTSSVSSFRNAVQLLLALGELMPFKTYGRVVACLIGITCEICPGSAGFSVEPQSSTSVILISVDTLRADRLSCYGSRRAQTPHIDAMTRGGTLFSEVSAQAPLTLPSHVSLLTSTYPFANGIEDNGEQLAPGAVTLATVLKLRGYRTAAFVGAFVLDRRFGLSQGFDVYESPFDLHREAGRDPGEIKRLGADVTQAATQWLRENSGAPFFLFLHLYDLHTPYRLPASVQARSRSLDYEAVLGYVDGVLGQFWEFLVQQGIASRSLIVFTSDHGESLGDHGESTHGYFIYQSTLRVPLVIHWPATAGPFVSRVDEPASLLDVAPTVLQFLGAPKPNQFQGRSLLGLLSQKTPGPAEEIYGESLYGHAHFGTSSLRCLRLGRYKYIEAPRPELFDLTPDPGEAHNLYAARRSFALTLRERLLSLRSRFQSTAAREGSPAVSPEVMERLNSLGYMAVSGARGAPPDSGPDPKDRIASYEKYGHAITLASAGRLKEANLTLTRLLAEDPDLLDVRLSLGLNQQKLGQHAEAAQNFRKVLKKDPLSALSHYDLAVSDWELHQPDDAVNELRLALAIEPYYTHAEELLGTIWLQQKRYDQARAQFSHLLTLNPDNYAAHYNLGALATLEGQWEDGERHLRAALKSDPLSAEAHNTLGSLYLRRQDLLRARDEFTAAIRLDPKFAWGHYNLGLTFHQQKRDAEAAREFHAALEADPQFRAARIALDRLEHR